MTERGLEDPFSCQLSRGGHVVKTAEQNSKFQETPSTYSFRNYCSTNLIFDKHVISILAPRFVLHVHVFCSQCLVIKFHSFPVRCLKDTSWKVATDEITYLPQSHLQLLPNLGERLKGRAVFSISHKLPFYKSFLVARGVKGLEGYLQIYKRLLKGRKLQHASGIIPIQTKI